jgi:hypothetical protein
VLESFTFIVISASPLSHARNLIWSCYFNKKLSFKSPLILAGVCDKESHFLVGGTDGPLRVADPEHVKSVMADTRAKKASKVIPNRS